MSMTPSNQSMAYRPQQMYVPQPFSPAQGSPNQGYNNTNVPLPDGQRQQPGRMLDYGMNANNVMQPAVVNSAYGAPRVGRQPLAGNYGSTSTPNQQRLAPPIDYSNINQALTYNPTTPSTNSNNQNNQSFNNFGFQSAPAPAYSTSNSEPPSLIIGGSSEITPNTPIDAASHHSGVREVLSPYSLNQPTEDIDFSLWLKTRIPIDELFSGGFNLNTNLGPEPNYPDSYGATRSINLTKPPNERMVPTSTDGYDNTSGVGTVKPPGAVMGPAVLEAWNGEWGNSPPDFSDSVHDGE
jgi:hypothetical protein